MIQAKGKVINHSRFSFLEAKSWVVGITLGKTAKAYDWNTLVKTDYL
jgi:hypothetical protein